MIVMINTLDKSGKDGLLISILETEVSTLATQQIDVAMIGAKAYCVAHRLKKAQVLALSIKDLEYQVKKEARPETDPKTVISAKYYDLLDIFSKKDLNILLSY